MSFSLSAKMVAFDSSSEAFTNSTTTNIYMLRVLPAGAADPATEPIEKKKDPLYWAEKSAPGVPFRFNCSFAASEDEAERCVFGVTSMNRASRAAGKFTIEISREADNSD